MFSAGSDGREGCRVRLHFGWQCALVANVLGMGAAQATAQCADGELLQQRQKLTASDAGTRDAFGVSVSLSENTALVGAFFDSCAGGAFCGSAYVFRSNGTSWVQEQKLTASDAAPDDLFGFSSSVSGDTAVVGAQNDGCAAGGSCGAAYVFRFNGTSWVEEQKLTASDAADNDQFGYSVSVSGGRAVVGAGRDDCAGGDACGAAYVFRFNGTAWVEQQKLVASDAGVLDRFGDAVSMSGDIVLVGAAGAHCAASTYCGAAYVFQFDGISWFQKQKLTASDATGGEYFGSSVSISGDTALVGASEDGCAAGGVCGSAYVFRFNGTSWVEEQKLTASDADSFAKFGNAVSVSGDTALVGANGDGCCGSAYVFRFNGSSWDEEQKLTATDAGGHDLFGVSVSVTGETALLGARGNGCTAGDECGATYMFACAFACESDAQCPEGEVCDIATNTCVPNDVVPTLSQWGMIFLALLLLATGKIVFRRTSNSSVSA